MIYHNPITIKTYMIPAKSNGELLIWLRSLQWRLNERDCASNNCHLDCLLNCLFRRRSIHQSPATLAFVSGIHRWEENSPPKGPVTRKMFPFDDVTMVSFGNPRGMQNLWKLVVFITSNFRKSLFLSIMPSICSFGFIRALKRKLESMKSSQPRKDGISEFWIEPIHVFILAWLRARYHNISKKWTA